MVFCALNAMYFVATAGFVTGMYVAPPEARAMSAHGQRMAKKREKDDVAQALMEAASKGNNKAKGKR